MAIATERLNVTAESPAGVSPVDLIIACAAVIAGLYAGWHAVAWARMWTVAGALFFAFKWLTWRSEPCLGQTKFWKSLGYFVAWPGLDADAFFRVRQTVNRSSLNDWRHALIKTGCGAGMIWGVVRFLPGNHPQWIGALGMAGIVLFLHFGTFHLLALIWQARGAAVEPIMHAPARSTSVADFWGNRWNRAYRRVSLDYFFRPLVRRCGPACGTLLAFVISGLIHELVISLPAGAGYGGPTCYFALQGVALLAERSSPGRRFCARGSVRSRIWTALVIIGPVGLLFHGAFLTTVIVPFLHAIGAR